jgi:hypothetical protein
MSNYGPQTPEGKSAIVRAQLKHGLCAVSIVLPSESEDDWIAFHDAILDHVRPEGLLEAGLASRVAELMWRIRRVGRIEQQYVGIDEARRGVVNEHRRERREGKELQEPKDQQATNRALGFYADAIIGSVAATEWRRSQPVLLPTDDQLNTVLRYEAHLSRHLDRALHELEALQSRRAGQSAPLMRIDVAEQP